LESAEEKDDFSRRNKMAGPLLPTPEELNDHQEKPIDWNCECDCCASRNEIVRDMMKEYHEVIANYATAIKKALWAYEMEGISQLGLDEARRDTIKLIGQDISTEDKKNIGKHSRRHNKWGRQLERRLNALEDLI